MATDAHKVLVGSPDQKVTGAILSAPTGTPLPENIDSELDDVFTKNDSGYVSSDGLTLTPDISTNDINDWSGALVRRVLESFNGTVSWTYIQTGVNELRNAFGDNNVEVTAEANTEHGTQIKVSIGAQLPERKSWIFKMKDGDARVMIVVPDANVTSMDDISFVGTDPVSWPITISCYPDSEGNFVYILLDDGEVVKVDAVHVTGVTVDSTATVNVNATKRLTASVQPENATDKTLVWKSSNTGVATVDSDGTVHGVKVGTANISVVTKDGSYAAVCAVTVAASA